ncbi:BTAD domain-containing putative transcriptional regulator [Kitasatospora sp. HPMI-4]|uniref:AfsR/SARP family transcriptional regulator n=1 Tax=Kitasatospora sp. HPMI-4 TaxID=3448443 RepID=UPI003F1BF40E
MDKINFRVLGPLEVRLGGRWCPVPSAKQRLLLALLLAEAGRVVPTERIIDELWGERPPATGAKVVATYVLRLRALLGDEAGVVLLTRSPGYLLAVGEEEVDALLLGRLAERAQRARAAGELAAARTALDAAVELSAGPPFADVQCSPTVTAFVAGIESRLLDVREARADVYAGLGRHQELLPELRAAVAEHPYRESLWVRLIRALHGAGRRVEGLDAYRRARALLVAELGVEPGAELLALHHELLRESDAPPQPPRDAQPPSGAVPRQHAGPARPAAPTLPAAPAQFVGRAAQLAELSVLLGTADGPPPVVVLSGMAGVGKTALALRVCEQMSACFPDGQLFLTLRHTDPVADLLQALGVSPYDLPTSPAAALALLRRLLAGSRRLLIVDDVWSAAQVGPLLQAVPGCAVLLTSRSALPTVAGARRLTLDPLDAAEGRELLARLAGPERVAAEPRAAARIVHRCGRLPLALRVIGARLASRPAWSLELMADRLRFGHSRLDQLELDDLSVRGSLALTYESLADSPRAAGRHAALLLRRAGALALPSYSLPVLAHLADLGTAEAELAADLLVDAALFTERSPGRFTLHDLVRDFAGELARHQEAPEQRTAAVGRALGWYADRAVAAARCLLVPGDPRRARLPVPCGPAFASAEEARAWWDAERENLTLDLVDRVPARTAPHHLRRLLTISQALFAYLADRGSFSELVTVTRLARQLAAGTGDPVADAYAHADLSCALYMNGEFEESLVVVDETIRRWRPLGDPRGLAVHLTHRGIMLERLGRDAEARTTLTDGLRLSRELADPHTEARALSALGSLLERSDPAAAVEYHLRSMAVGEPVHPELFVVGGHRNVAGLQLRLGRPRQALRNYRAAAEGAGDWHAEREARIGVLRSLRGAGELDRAEWESMLLIGCCAYRGDRYGEELALAEQTRISAARQDVPAPAARCT